MANQVGIAWEQDETLMMAHGLQYSVSKCRVNGVTSVESVLLNREGDILVEPPELGCSLAFDTFIGENTEYIKELIREFQSISTGL